MSLQKKIKTKITFHYNVVSLVSSYKSVMFLILTCSLKKTLFCALRKLLCDQVL